MKVLITGGSGLLGRAITKKLIAQKIEVVHLTRTKNSASGVKTFEWDWENNTIDEACFNGVTHIIHLAGAGIADKPWTTQRKRTIIKSRVLTARLIHEKINQLNIPIKAFISASGIGYYGAITTEKKYSEKDKPHNDFISECCIQWEEAADLFESYARVVKLRLGIILDKDKGALPKILSIIKKGIGAPLGKGNQYMPWIHIDDATELFIYSLKNEEINGTFNAVVSQHVNNSEFTHCLAKVNNKKIRLPNVPAFIMKGIYGELADILLYGSRIDNSKIIKEGFEFKFQSLEKALNNIYN
jgi:uncharacterized protein (TIGR01777 family)